MLAEYISYEFQVSQTERRISETPTTVCSHDKVLLLLTGSGPNSMLTAMNIKVVLPFLILQAITDAGILFPNTYTMLRGEFGNKLRL